MSQSFLFFKRKFYLDTFKKLPPLDLENKDFLGNIQLPKKHYGKLLGMKNTILNLVYPAILGAIIYAIIAYTPDPISKWSDIKNYWSESVGNKIGILSLIGIIVFFLCDYLHLYVVRSYSFWHFLIHLLTSILLLKAALCFLPKNAGGTAEDIADNYARVFWIFLFISAVYLAHDIGLLHKNKIHEMERPLYEAYARTNLYFLMAWIIIAILPFDADIKLLVSMILLIGATVVYFYLLPRKNAIERAKADQRKKLTILNAIKEDSGISTAVDAIKSNLNTISGTVTTLNKSIGTVESNIQAANKKIGELNTSINAANEQIRNLNNGSSKTEG